jgi:peptidoglycan/LPS O-acetylase OafA/YrhL
MALPDNLEILHLTPPSPERPPPWRPSGVMLAYLLAAFVFLFVAHPAYAQSGDGTNPNPAIVVAYSAFFYAVFGGLVSALQPSNTALPWSIPQSARATILVVAGVVQACLLAITQGTPWVVAIGTAVVTMLSTYAKHGADKTTPAGPAPAKS